ncbi:MAG: hypothetical protein EB023_06400 [Flavobacteriia bacterium]|nr:hypothetical protein [Flavobacteriia bacterium]
MSSRICRKRPFVGVALLISLLSLSGIPPFTGFFGKMLLIQDILIEHPVLGIAAILSAVVGAYVYIKLLLEIFKKDETQRELKVNLSSTVVILISLFLLIFGWLLLFI